MNSTDARLEAVGKRYGRHRAIERVDFTMRAGERVALVGHNGAGKSTLIKLMLGLSRPSEGCVEVLGTDPGSRASGVARRSIGFLPENVVFHPSATGAELLAFYARLKRQPVASNPALLERVGIADAASRRVGTYSKGMRQRLGLAQALIGRPRVLLLDEPTTGLDPALRQSFYRIVGELAADGAAVLLSSHALAELENTTDRVVVLDRGLLVADGALAELRRRSEAPTRIRVTLTDPHAAIGPGLPGGDIAWARISDVVWEASCPELAKVEALRDILGAALPLADIAVIPPSLDQIYAGFLDRKAAE
jgi:Cu-processing system ATP-binding protein